jgi:hypothetical protein
MKLTIKTSAKLKQELSDLFLTSKFNFNIVLPFLIIHHLRKSWAIKAWVFWRYAPSSSLLTTLCRYEILKALFLSGSLSCGQLLFARIWLDYPKLDIFACYAGK